MESGGSSPVSPMLKSEVWAKAQTAMPRFSAGTFFALVLVPTALTALFVAVFVHDLWVEKRPWPCWRGGEEGLDWAGWFVHWLSMDFLARWESQEFHCKFVPSRSGLPIYFWILPPTWMVIINSSWVTRRMRRDKGIIRSLLEKVFLACEAAPGAPGGASGLEGYLGGVERSEQTLALLEALKRDGLATKVYHICFAVAFQVAMFLFDYYLKQYPMRWILCYQVLWFSFSTTIVQVRPLLKFSVFLSRTLVDLYIEVLRKRKDSWLQLLEWHRQLELDLLELWGRVNLHAVLPSTPFISLSLLHLMEDSSVDPNVVAGAKVATFLLAVAGLVLVCTLMPIAKVDSMLNSGLAFKAQPPRKGGLRKPGGMAIVAVARSLALERPPRTPEEDQQYATFLEYVQGGEFHVALGVPGYFMVPITSSTVVSIFTTFILKFPLFMSLFLTARERVAARDQVHEL